MTTTITYRFLGIPIWSVTRKTEAADEDALYDRMSKRFSEEMQKSLEKAGRR